tara:strand:- start:1184 stop:1345 length:162 start_codon:yes stop_codon:yes gene_type:complete
MYLYISLLRFLLFNVKKIVAIEFKKWSCKKFESFYHTLSNIEELDFVRAPHIF